MTFFDSSQSPVAWNSRSFGDKEVGRLKRRFQAIWDEISPRVDYTIEFVRSTSKKVVFKEVSPSRKSSSTEGAFSREEASSEKTEVPIFIRPRRRSFGGGSSASAGHMGSPKARGTNVRRPNVRDGKADVLGIFTEQISPETSRAPASVKEYLQAVATGAGEAARIVTTLPLVVAGEIVLENEQYSDMPL